MLSLQTENIFHLILGGSRSLNAAQTGHFAIEPLWVLNWGGVMVVVTVRTFRGLK
jgi:hypothetical protein